MNKITSINGTLLASLNELKEHTENGTVHVTEDERTAWNTQATVKAKGILIATQEDLDEHTGNKAIHVEEEERTAWNAKADASALSTKTDTSVFDAHKNDAAVHITGKERETWNGKQDKLMDEAGNMTLAGGLTTSATINANGGVNIPVAIGIPTDTSAVNRMYAGGLAAVTNIYTSPAFLKSDAITATNSARINVLIPNQLVGVSTSVGGHTTLIASFERLVAQWNYSSWCGVSYIWSANYTSKFTLGIGRGSKTTRKDLSIDSFTMIPGNGLEQNTGEVLDITLNSVRDAGRQGHVIMVREIYWSITELKWKLKTTSSFIPASHNEPIPRLVHKIIYQQRKATRTWDEEYSNDGALWLLLTGGATKTLWKIATCRGVGTFEGAPPAQWCTDIASPSSNRGDVSFGGGEYTFYQADLVNPVYYGLDALSSNAIISEETTDFVDINIPWTNE